LSVIACTHARFRRCLIRRSRRARSALAVNHAWFVFGANALVSLDVQNLPVIACTHARFRRSLVRRSSRARTAFSIDHVGLVFGANARFRARIVHFV
jgi:hypothetical protein